MNARAIAFTTCLLLWGAPLAAKPLMGSLKDNPAGHLELLNITRLIGWIQATCQYAEMGQLSPQVAEIGIKGMMMLITKESGADMAAIVLDMTLKEHAPKCRSFWPRQYLQP
jgi:hypothetical protein